MDNTFFNKIKKKITTRKIDKLFLYVFFVALFIPMMKISNEEVSKNEKRILAKYPSLFIENHFNKNYTASFDKWFSDRFNGRKQLIKFYSKLKNRIDQAGSDPKVFYGNDGWLFYKGSNSLDNFQNKNIFTEEELIIIAQNLSKFDFWAKKNGKSFYCLIAPDKNKIYGEYITSLKKVRPDEESRANLLVKYLKENSTVNIIYPYKTLLENKDKGLLYYKQDTHWNDFGAFVAYKEIMNIVKKDHKDISIVIPNKQIKVMYKTGELLQMVNFASAKDKTEYFKPEITDTSTCTYDSKTKGEKKTIECNNPFKTMRMITFRDSFTIALERYYNNTFQTVKYENSYDITPENLEYIKKNFDIIILEIVERHIPELLSLKFPEI